MMTEKSHWYAIVCFILGGLTLPLLAEFAKRSLEMIEQAASVPDVQLDAVFAAVPSTGSILGTKYDFDEYKTLERIISSHPQNESGGFDEEDFFSLNYGFGSRIDTITAVPYDTYSSDEERIPYTIGIAGFSVSIRTDARPVEDLTISFFPNGSAAAVRLVRTGLFPPSATHDPVIRSGALGFEIDLNILPKRSELYLEFSSANVSTLVAFIQAKEFRSVLVVTPGCVLEPYARDQILSGYDYTPFSFESRLYDFMPEGVDGSVKEAEASPQATSLVTAFGPYYGLSARSDAQLPTHFAIMKLAQAWGDENTVPWSLQSSALDFDESGINRCTIRS